MSGHSKWAQIKRQKSVADIKRGQAFTKIANAITIAVRQGGGIGEPEKNFRLRLTIEKARSINMPKENINRAIERGMGKGVFGGLEEVVYEGFTPFGASIIVEAVTDNKQRTTSEIKNIFDKNGGTMATPGAVSYQFTQKGLITVKKNGKTLDDIFLMSADFGAEDVEEAGEEVIIYTKPEELAKIKDSFSKEGIAIVEAGLTRKPLTYVQISNKEQAGKVLSFIEKLENLDDVQKVYANFDVPDTIIGETVVP